MTLTISKGGIALIKQFEGFSATAYNCPAGKLTIGYGHVIAPGSGLNTPFAHLSEAEAEKLLLEDLKPVQAAVNRLVRVPLTQPQFDALCSFVYNVGVTAFAGSTLLRKINSREEGASQQFLRWVYSGKNTLPGLKKRRAAEKELFDKTIG